MTRTWTTEHPYPDEDARDFSAGASAGAPKVASPRARLPVISAAEIITAPPPVTIVEGVAYADCLTVLVSESGAGKTFGLLDLAGAVSDGERWHGREVRCGSVLYFGFEGDALGLRLRALRDVAGRRLEHVYVVRASDPLSPRLTRVGEECSSGELDVIDAVDALAAELRAANRPPITLAIVDTVRASLAGSEDSSEHVSAYLRAVRRVMGRIPGAAVILAHHTGWQDGDTKRRRERGSSAWRGNSDVTLYLSAGEYDEHRGEAQLTLTCLKVRDSERPGPLHLIRRRVDCHIDPQGRLLTSCVIEADRRSREDRDAERTAATEAEHRAIDLEVLRALRDRRLTSEAALRDTLGFRRDIVVAAVGRILRAGWATKPERQRQPYELTELGHEALNEGSR